MDHHDDVRAGLERLAVTRHLVPAVAVIRGVGERGQAEALRNAHRLVGAGVVHKDPNVDLGRQIGNRALQGPRTVVCGKHDGEALSANHAYWTLSSAITVPLMQLQYTPNG